MTRTSKPLPPSPPIKVSCKILHETAKAVLIEDLSERKHWIPLSQVTELHKVEEGLGEGSYVVMREWIAKEKDLL